MKKFLKISGVLLLLIVAALVLIPYLFKDKIVAKVKSEANKQLNAKLDFEGVDLTFFAHFPDLTLELEDLSISGIDEFDGIELMRVESFEMTLGLRKLFKGELPEILGIYVHRANINVLILPDGKSNYDIVKESTDTEPEVASVEEGDSDSFSMKLNYYEFTEANIRYEDQSAATILFIENMNHSGSGDFGTSDFVLHTTSSIEKLMVEYEKEVYVNNWALEAKIDMEVNLDNYRFTLTDNEVKINELLLKAEGVVEMPDSAITMDLKIEAPTMTLRQLFSLLPPSYTSDMDGMTFDGNCNFSTWIKGDYTDTSYPLFAIDLNVSNGSFKHKDLPKSAKNIQIACHVELPDANDMDAMWIDISKFNLDLGGNMINSGFKLRKPESTMDFNARLSAMVDLSTLKDVLPSEDAETYSGIIEANLEASGSLGEIEKEDYSNLNASGKLKMENFEYSSSQFSQPVKIQNMLMDFQMDEVKLESFNATIGSSDFIASGMLRDFIPYALYDKELYGELKAQSHFLNVDEMMSFMLEDSTVSDSSVAVAETEVQAEVQNDSLTAMFPKNIHFMLKTGIDKLQYEDFNITAFQGDLELDKGVLKINPSSAKAFEGTMTIAGMIDESIVEQPYASFDLNVDQMNIKQCAAKIEMVKKYAPVAQYASGSFSGKVKFNSQLDKTWSPIYPTVYSKGNLKTKGVRIEGYELLDKIAAITKTEDILKQDFENIDIEYEIIDGKGYIKPFNFKIDQLTGNSYGSIDLEENIDFDVKMAVPTAMLGSNAGALLGQVAGALSALGMQSEVPEKISMDIKITGTIEKPIIKPNFAGLAGNLTGAGIKETIKETITEEIDKAKDEALARASEEAEKIMADARAKSEALLKEAQQNVDKLKKEGYEQADKLVKDAKGMIEQVAAKAAAAEMKKQIDKQAVNAMAEAQKQADKILEDAQKQADRLKN